jgi:hypothetical protein
VAEPAEVARVEVAVVQQEQARVQPARLVRRPVRAVQPTQVGLAPATDGGHRDQEPEELIRA